MVYLMVRFTVSLENVAEYERIFEGEFLPVIREHGLELVGAFRTVVGEAGEFHELWRFDGAADFETKWKALFDDPRTAAIVARTGPLVKDEVTRLMEPTAFSPRP